MGDSKQSKSTRSGWRLIILFVVLGLVAAAGGMLGQPLIEKISNFLNTRKADKTTPTVIDESGLTLAKKWEVYENKEMKFRLRQPPATEVGRQLKDKYGQSIMFRGGEAKYEVEVRKIDGGITFDNYKYLEAPVKGKATLGGRPANIFELPKGYCEEESCTQPFLAFVAEKGGVLYHVNFYGDTELSEVEEQILASFYYLD